MHTRVHRVLGVRARTTTRVCILRARTVILSILRARNMHMLKNIMHNMHTPGASITVCLVYICHKCILPISETTSDSTDRIYELVEKKNPLVVTGSVKRIVEIP